jgi:hypothetical protein
MHITGNISLPAGNVIHRPGNVPFPSLSFAFPQGNEGQLLGNAPRKALAELGRNDLTTGLCSSTIYAYQPFIQSLREALPFAVEKAGTLEAARAPPSERRRDRGPRLSLGGMAGVL